MKTASARMLASALILSATIASSSCATRTEYVELRPECSVPPQPALPEIKGEALAGLSDEVYWDLEKREKRLTDWALEMRAALQELCGKAAKPAD